MKLWDVSVFFSLFGVLMPKGEKYLFVRCLGVCMGRSIAIVFSIWFLSCAPNVSFHFVELSFMHVVRHVRLCELFIVLNLDVIRFVSLNFLCVVILLYVYLLGL